MARVRFLLWACAAALVVLAVVGTWPRDAVPSFRTACDTCASLGGGRRDAPTHAVFVDSGTARFVKRVTPFTFWLWVALSPVGFCTVTGVRWLADLLHRLRQKRQTPA